MTPTKLFIHPSGGYLLETLEQNIRFTETGAIRTSEVGDGMEEAYPDIQVQATIDNCLSNAGNALNDGEIKEVQEAVQTMINNA